MGFFALDRCAEWSACYAQCDACSPSRYDHYADLVATNGSYRALFQSNSWYAGLSTGGVYNAVSYETDDAVHQTGLTVVQGIGNFAEEGDITSEGVAKNVLSIGGVRHNDTLARSDDRWTDASAGPTSDGRIKPDLCHFYDGVFTTQIDGDPGTPDPSYANFSGTSAATPIVSGHLGILLEMWSHGVFGNVGCADPFDCRPKWSTSKALLVNTAYRYDWYSVPEDHPNANIDRFKQGWGMPDLWAVYERADYCFIVDESALLTNLQVHSYSVTVPPTSPFGLRVTLVYADPAGVVGSSIHRVNDLSLRVVSPSGVGYWGNQGLLASNWSSSDGAEDHINTVENVFVASPASGNWTIKVVASQIVKDGYLETQATDSAYALVVTGVSP